MEPFATLAELQNRLDWTLSPSEVKNATAALDDASMLVRAYGRNWINATSAPALAKTLTLGAATRYMRNPDGYTQSRAGDETLAWADQGDNAGALYLSKGEIKLLQRLVRPNGIVSVPLTAWGPMKPQDDRTGYVPAAGSPNSPVPYYAGDGPW